MNERGHLGANTRMMVEESVGHRKPDAVGTIEDDAGGVQGHGEEQYRCILQWYGQAGGGRLKPKGIFTFSASSLTSRVPRLAGLSTRKRLRRFSQSVDM